MTVLRTLKEKKLAKLFEVQTSNPATEDGSALKKITVVTELSYSIDTPEVKSAIARYFDLQQEKFRTWKEDAQRASLRESINPLLPLILRLNALTALLMNYFVSGDHSTEETMCLDPDLFLESSSSQQLAALYGFVDQEVVILEPNITPAPHVMSKWKDYFLEDLNILRVSDLFGWLMNRFFR